MSVYPDRNGVLWSEWSVVIGDWHQLPRRVSQDDCEGGVLTVVSVAGQVWGDAEASLMLRLWRCVLGVERYGGLLVLPAWIMREQRAGGAASRPAAPSKHCKPRKLCHHQIHTGIDLAAEPDFQQGGVASLDAVWQCCASGTTTHVQSPLLVCCAARIYNTSFA